MCSLLFSGLLFSWFEHLKAPILSVEELSYLVLAAHKPEVVLRKMDRVSRQSLELFRKLNIVNNIVSNVHIRSLSVQF